MSIHLSTKEKLIQFFILKFNKDENNKNTIHISRDDIKSIGISESEASKYIQLMQTSNLLIIKDKSVHNDFSKFWTVELTESCIHYFETQKERKTEKRNNWIQFWIPVTISILALIVAIVTA